MSDSHEKGLVPALRFHEFRDTGDWEKNSLGNICSSISSGKDKSDSNGKYYLYGSTGIIGKTSSATFEGCFILVARVGANAGLLTKTNGKFGVTDNTLVVSLNNLINMDFIFYSLKRLGLNKLVFGSGQPLITGSQLKNLDINLPSKLEQQKISDCLSSLDELISLQAQKLGELKIHKKGLMQELFPSEEEATPKCRFPEFQDTGEWEEKSLDFLTLKISDGIHTTPVYDDSGEYYFINGNNLVNGIISINTKDKKVSKDEYKKHKRELNENTILLSINGTIGNISTYNNEKVILGKSACYINVDKEKSARDFTIYFLQIEKIQNYFNSELTGSTIKNLSLKTIKNTKINLPSKLEQQKIADFLTSLDDLISAQSKKIYELKAHKKGLMQQLFPSISDVNDE